jgi:Tfp pilus assembly protein PilZ
LQVATLRNENRQYNRHSRRIVCLFQLADGKQRAFISNISARGFFIQTRSRPEPGEEIMVTIEGENGDIMFLTGSVARTRRTHRAMSSIDQAGIGIEILSAPEAYYQMVLEFEEKD